MYSNSYCQNTTQYYQHSCPGYATWKPVPQMPKTATTPHLVCSNCSPWHNMCLGEVSVEFLMYLITCELRLHLCLMSKPDSKGWVILSLRLVRGIGRAWQGQVFRHETVAWAWRCGFCSRAQVAVPLVSQILQRNVLCMPEGGSTVHAGCFQCA